MSASAVKFAAAVAQTAPSKPNRGSRSEFSTDVRTQADEQSQAAQAGPLCAPQVNHFAIVTMPNQQQ